LITSGKVQVEWDAEEFSLRAKATVEKNGWISPSNESLINFFPDVCFGHIAEPAIIIDRHGRIIVWYLPHIVSQVVVGDQSMLVWQSFPKSTSSPFSTMRLSISKTCYATVSRKNLRGRGHFGRWISKISSFQSMENIHQAPSTFLQAGFKPIMK
jgi:hypothetical protein